MIDKPQPSNTALPVFSATRVIILLAVPLTLLWIDIKSLYVPSLSTIVCPGCAYCTAVARLSGLASVASPSFVPSGDTIRTPFSSPYVARLTVTSPLSSSVDVILSLALGAYV